MRTTRLPTNSRTGTSVPLALHVDQTSAEVWRLPGAVTLSGQLDNVVDPDKAQVKVQVRGLEPVIAPLSILDHDESGRSRLGWSVHLSLECPRTGPLVVTVLASVGRDSVALRRTIAVAPGHDGPTGELCSPALGDTIAGDVLVVRGWCLFPDSRTARVAVYVDGTMVGLARTYTEHSGETSEHPDASLCGFESVLNVRRSERGDVTQVSVEATSLDGRRWRSSLRTVTWSTPPLDWDDAARVQSTAVRNTEVVRAVPCDRSAVIVFTHFLGISGAQLWLEDIVRRVVAGGRSRCVVVALHDGDLRPVLEAMGVEVHITGLASLGAARPFEGYVHELALFIRAHGGGVVLVNTLLCFPAVLAAARADVPSVWAIHESIEPATFFHHYGRTGFYADTASDFHPVVREQYDWSFRVASALLFVATQTETLFHDVKGSTPSLTLGYGIDPNPIADFRAANDRALLRSIAGFAPTDIVLLAVGVFDARKSIGLVVAAFDELSVVHENVHLVIAGSYPSSYAEAVERQVQRCHHASRIRIEPVTSDIYRYHAIADLFVSAADVESLPRSLMEATAFDLPIVAADAFGVQDLVPDPWLTRPRDLEGLIGLLHSVLRMSAKERAEVSLAGREREIRRNDGKTHDEFFAHALDALCHHPDSDVRDLFTAWNDGKQKGAVA
jgi:glycosyltransferase involved in cell wall biosynthesis